jgi:hypothetical protein
MFRPMARHEVYGNVMDDLICELGIIILVVALGMNMKGKSLKWAKMDGEKSQES